MNRSSISICSLLMAGVLLASCTPSPYAKTNHAYEKQVKAYSRTIRMRPDESAGGNWVGTTNFNLRKPNYVVLHHTAQNSAGQTLKTFTTPQTSVSAHYVIGRDGKVYHMLNDYLRAWHGGVGSWGNNTDINSSSIGIELDNNGSEPFTEAQINSLLQVLARLKADYNIPTANFIGHSDIAPARKSDPNRTFPWKQLAENGFGLWYDEPVPHNNASGYANTALPAAEVPLHIALIPDSSAFLTAVSARDSVFIQSGSIRDSARVQVLIQDRINPREALRIIGYDTKDLKAAIRAFKLHFVQTDVSDTLTASDKEILLSLYKKYL